MRLCTPASLFLAVVAAILPGAAQAHAEAPPPACATAGESDFPLTTRVHGGPDSYRAGGGFGTWYLELTNTTDRPCAGIHPVVVLVDDRRELQASQPVLEFYAKDRELPHTVRFETTDEDELVGALADDDAGFGGFTVEAGRTLTVKLRLALTSDAVAGEVVATAAVVQRHEDDGDWVGQSDEYRFRIRTGAGAGTGTEPAPEADDPGSDGTDPASPTPRGSGFPLAHELSGTGLGGLNTALAVTALLLAAGSVAVLLGRRRR
ncbi:hypothetical protein [Streptomyces sp. KMM 9044]|uniref:hypothetical protein n=1 Tax=Streptomyces sp. KMM 9044 TaxID=2744474 RepID=UPI0021510EA3|nr:hypothetical protein [Streptomyces sp. KMM 9044]WAX79830.1 hypothetical protein HUV60_021315 [Streptomyces sp. KMM 9044]